MATKGIKLTDKNNNIYLPVTSADLVEVNYGGQAQVLSTLLESNEQVTAEALIDLNNRLENCVQLNDMNGFSAPVSYTRTEVTDGGLISGVPMNRRNTTSGNIVTMGVHNEGTSPVISYDSPESRKQYSTLRYETPLIKVCQANTDRFGNVSSSFPAPSNSTRYMNYYDPIVNSTKKANIYGSGSTNVAYSPMIDGNNYCDVSSTTYEMYFFNTNKLRNYLTVDARIDLGRPDIKEMNPAATLFWGKTNQTVTDKLKITANEIGFGQIWTGRTQPTALGECSTSITKDLIVTNDIALMRTVQAALNGPETGHDWNTRLNYSYFRMKDGSTIYAEISNTGAGVTFNQSTYATKFYETSDERLKNNITPLTYNPGINIYSFIKNKNTTYSYGFVAQNVVQTHPELIAYSYESSYMSVDYNSTLSLLLAQAMNKISELENRVEKLENKLSEK